MKNRFEGIREHGLPLGKLNMIMLLMALVISIILTIAMQMTTSLYNETHEITQHLVTWRKSAYDLQLASDFLTEQIRCFAVTGEKGYLDDYFREANIEKRREHALEELATLSDQTEAFSDLSKAMDASMNLMNTEFKSAKLAALSYGYNLSDLPLEVNEYALSEAELSASADVQRNQAIEILFNDAYHTQKNYISNHMSKCLNDLEAELAVEQARIASSLKNQVYAEHLLTFILIMIMFIIVFMTSRMIITPLQKCVDYIRDETDIPLKGAYEIQFLAKTYNIMYNTNLASRQKLSYEATHDKLTGLYNRRGYDFLVQNTDWETSALILFDLDQFKDINDTYGHDIGDKVLKKSSEIIFGSFRTQDYVCRLGGDEFAVIMVHAEKELEPLLRKKVNLINTAMKQHDDDFPEISASVGVAFGGSGDTFDKIFKGADSALYKTKENGRCGVNFA